MVAREKARRSLGHLHTDARYRVSTGFQGGQWFEFGPRSYDDPKPAKTAEFYDGIAEKTVELPRRRRRALVRKAAHPLIINDIIVRPARAMMACHRWEHRPRADLA